MTAKKVKQLKRARQLALPQIGQQYSPRMENPPTQTSFEVELMGRSRYRKTTNFRDFGAHQEAY